MGTSRLEQLERLRADPLLSQPAATPSAPSAPKAPIPTQNVSSILRAAQTAPRLSSGSSGFDSLVVLREADTQQGLVAGQVLELNGCPGEGKTRTCISYAIQACLSGDKPDIQPRVLIIDTQGGITLQALQKAASAVSDESTSRILLSRMLHWNCYESDDLLVALHALRPFIEEQPSIKLVIIDSLSAPMNSYLVPALSAQIVAEQGNTGQRGNNGSAKRRKRNNPNYNPRQDAAYGIVRNIMGGLVKNTLLTMSARDITVIVTTQSTMKLVDEFGDRASGRDAKHSLAVPYFFPYWHIPKTIQVILSAAGDGSRVAMVTETPSGLRGRSVVFQTVGRRYL